MRARAALLGLALALAPGCRRDEAGAQLEAARAARLRKDPDAALAAYKRALDLVERDASALAAARRAEALRGAADLYAFELEDPKRAVEVYRELISLCPEAPETAEARLHLARLLQHRFRDLRGAIAAYAAARARTPAQAAELGYTVARLYFELQDYEQCQLEAAQLASQHPSSPLADDALSLRAQALSMMEGRKGEAARLLAELLERFPDTPLRPHVLVDLGQLKAEGGEADAALALWVEALATHPTPAVVQGQIARLRQRRREATPEGIGDAEKAFDFRE